MKLSRGDLRLIESKASLARVIKRARANVNDYGLYVLGIEDCAMHREWQAFLSEPGKFKVIVAPRDHGKCLVEGELILGADGVAVPVEKWRGGEVLSLDPGSLEIKPAFSPSSFFSAYKKSYEIVTATGRRARVSWDHPFLRGLEWVKAEDLRVGDKVVVAVLGPEGYEIGSDIVVKKKFIGVQPCYGIEVDGLHNFVTGDGFITHNTSQIPIKRGSWEIGRNPAIRIKIGSHNDGKAAAICSALRSLIEYNERFRLVFPWVKPGYPWSSHLLSVVADGRWDFKSTCPGLNKDPTVEAMGITSGITSARADLLILDDVCDWRNSVSQPKLRETVKSSFRSAWLNTLEEDGRCWILGTLWHEKDLLSEIVEQARRGDKIPWKVRFYAIDENLNPLWPEKWSREALAERLGVLGLQIFDLAFRNRPLSDEDVFVADDELISALTTSRPVLKLVYMGVDPASSLSGRGSKSAIVVGGYDESLRKWATYFDIGRYSPTELATRILIAYLKFRPTTIMVETNGFQVALLDLVRSLSYIQVVRTYPEVRDFLVEEMSVAGMETSESSIEEYFKRKCEGMPLEAFFTSEEKRSLISGIPALMNELSRGEWSFWSDHPYDLICECPACEFVRSVSRYRLSRKTGDPLMAWWLMWQAMRLEGGASFDVIGIPSSKDIERPRAPGGGRVNFLGLRPR